MMMMIIMIPAGSQACKNTFKFHTSTPHFSHIPFSFPAAFLAVLACKFSRELSGGKKKGLPAASPPSPTSHPLHSYGLLSCPRPGLARRLQWCVENTYTRQGCKAQKHSLRLTPSPFPLCYFIPHHPHTAPLTSHLFTFTHLHLRFGLSTILFASVYLRRPLLPPRPCLWVLNPLGRRTFRGRHPMIPSSLSAIVTHPTLPLKSRMMQDPS